MSGLVKELRFTVMMGIFCAICLFAAFDGWAEGSKDCSPGMRKLTYRDWGLYCGNSTLPADKRSKDWHYYDGKFYFSENPWDFFVIQCSRVPEADGELRKIVTELNRNGKLAILRLPIWEKTSDSLEDCQKIADRMLAAVGPANVQVALGEENVYWDGHGAILVELYKYLKGKYPETTFYQWYTPPVAPDKDAKDPNRGWSVLPSDGWISDNYCVSGEKFERHVVRYLSLGVPLINMIWASPHWPLNINADVPRDKWWEEFGGSEQFECQLRISREYNIPVSFFVVQDRDPSHERRWGWEASDHEVLRFYKKLCVMAETADHIPGSLIGFRKATGEAAAWAEVAESGGDVLDVNDIGLPKVDSVWYAAAGKADGDNASGNQLYDVEMNYDAACEGIAVGKNSIGVKGVKDKVSSLVVNLKLSWKKPVRGFSIDFFGETLPELGGRYTIEASPDGESWFDSPGAKKAPAAQNVKKPKTYRFAGKAPGKIDKKREGPPLVSRSFNFFLKDAAAGKDLPGVLYIRIKLESSARIPTNPGAAVFRGLSISSYFSPGSFGELTSMDEQTPDKSKGQAAGQGDEIEQKEQE